MKQIIIIIVMILFLTGCSFGNRGVTNIKMIDLTTMSLTEIKEYTKTNKLNLKIEQEYNYDLSKDKIISQSITKNTIVKTGDTVTVVVSLGPIPVSVYQENKVNELGNIPIMMYHSIVNKLSDETPYTGGNVDKDGYNRTTEAFRNDLEMYYQSNYRMIRLIDYMNGIIDVKLGKSPIVLTFDDGNRDNINILGLDDKGNLMIDPNCAVGILESFKQKYPDFGVTATFFLNKGLFRQSKYNDKILLWLIDNGYDIGNHTKSHVDFNSADAAKSQEEVAYMYKLFDSLIPNKYVHIVALPFGSPGKKSHANFPYILEGTYEDYNYKTEGTLQVGCDADYSPFHIKYDKTFMKRVRAWDNNGGGFDIQMVFNSLEKNRYISDGDKNTIVISNDKNLNVAINDKKIIKY